MHQPSRSTRWPPVGQVPFNFPYKRGSQLPDSELASSERRAMVNGAPYPFGYGLSYTTFAYSNLTVTPAVQTPGGTIEVSVDVENTGDRAGDEIVQLYLSPRLTSVVYYDKVLPGFMRVPLKAREKTRVPFTRKPSDLQTLGRDNAMEG